MLSHIQFLAFSVLEFPKFRKVLRNQFRIWFGAKMKNISLKTIYLCVMTVVFVVSVAIFVSVDIQSQKAQREDVMLTEARVFAQAMDAVWQFMEYSQVTINNTSSGEYEFKGLHCSIVGRSVGTLFSKNNENDYAVRYTNFNPRNIQDIPDEFEASALTAFEEDRTTSEYYGIEEYEGDSKFRYLQVLEVDNSCLECHGEPAGEIDITGKVKEGWTLDSIGGAISIIIPLDQSEKDMQENIKRNFVFFLSLALLIGGTIYAATRHFIFRPLGKMEAAFTEMKGGTLNTLLDEDQPAKEINRMVVQFNDMATELKTVYSHLEEQVVDRTHDLQEANKTLESQRDILKNLNKELEQEAQFKSDLLSMVNHELRTPLTSIITLAQMSKGVSSSEQDTLRNSWDEVERNSSILLEMINNMLDIARSDAGKMHVSCEPMDLGDIVTAVRGTIVPLAQKYCVEFSSYIASDVPLIKGDYDKVQRVLENLASNAIKFTPDGGWVALQIERKEGAGGILISMSDNGIGIAEEDQERIFERFVQVDSTSTRKYNGSGLGLALVKEYSRMLGFEVSVESKLGQGSTFTIRIPEGAVICEDTWGIDDV